MSHRRFKTQDEFIAEFGKNWTGKIKNGWGSDMDHLFGQPFTGETSDVGHSGLQWTISHDMLTFTSPEHEAAYKKLLEYRKEFEIRFKSNYQDGLTVLKYSSKYLMNTITFYIQQTPTGNCQLASISCFDAILSVIGDTEEIREILQYTYRTTSKPLLFFDVHQKYETIIKRLNPIFAQPYISTNRSKMLAGILNLNSLTNETVQA